MGNKYAHPKKRIQPGISKVEFLELLLQARGLQILSITGEIAALATDQLSYEHADPADRIIAATALHHRAKLITCDTKLQAFPDLVTIWD